MSAIWFLLMMIVIVLAIWQSVEICHHSAIGAIWRDIGESLTQEEKTKWIGDGMLCPFCFSNWFGFLYVGLYSIYMFNFVEAIAFTFIGGLAMARLANLLNDIFHDRMRTPNVNENSRTEKFRREINQEYEDGENHE